MARRRRFGWFAGAIGGLAVAGTTPDALAESRAAPGSDARAAAIAKLLESVGSFAVSGAVKTEDGLLLPESIAIEIKSEICVESREPGARFWSLDFDTCFAFVARDSLDAVGEYSVSVPCLDADATYESRHPFGDLRLIQRGPVSFLAVSDAGWNHHETFTSSRTQRRDLLLTLEPEVFWVVKEGGDLRERPLAAATAIRRMDFGTGVPVVRFHEGWAEVVVDDRIAWMEMRFLGTEKQLEEARPFRGKPAVEPLPVPESP
ncbi:MAG: hypothetical protein ACT4PE_12125 [Candidatus Eiseniibacteriota bacterium]